MEREVAGVKFKTSIYNAAGCHCTTAKHLDEIFTSGAGAVITKSCTFEARAGNERPKYYDDGDLSINSNGLENMGHIFYLDYAEVVAMEMEKPLILSVAGLSRQENAVILSRASETDGIAMIELNLSCPNLAGHTPVSYDLDSFENYLKELVPLSGDKPLGLKLPPYFMSSQFERVGRLVERYEVDFITCINSMPKGMVVDWTEECRPAIKNKLGGIGGGKFMKAIALGNVYQFEKHTSVPIVMCGGISSGRDCYEGMCVGASLFQVGTQLMVEGPQVFDRLNVELIDVLGEDNSVHCSFGIQ